MLMLASAGFLSLIILGSLIINPCSTIVRYNSVQLASILAVCLGFGLSVGLVGY